MVKQLLVAVMVACGSSAACAEAVLSCEQVDQMGEALTTLGVALEDEQMEIGEGSEEHTQLLEITEGLAEIAGAEGDEDLANAALGMAEAWGANDRDAFTTALATAVAKLAVIHGSDCR